MSEDYKGDNGKEHGNYRNYRGYIGIIQGYYIEDYIGIMEKKMETTIIGYILGYILGL